MRCLYVKLIYTDDYGVTDSTTVLSNLSLEQVLNENNNYKQRAKKNVATRPTVNVAPQQKKLEDNATTKSTTRENQVQPAPTRTPNYSMQAVPSMQQDLRAMLQRYSWAQVG